MSHETILMVNDGARMLPWIGGLFAARGCRVTVLEEPEAGLAFLAGRGADLVVVPVSAASSDRLAFLHMVKELCPTARLAVISHTQSLPLEALEADADDYLLLPCRPVDLYRRLCRVLGPRVEYDRPHNGDAAGFPPPCREQTGAGRKAGAHRTGQAPAEVITIDRNGAREWPRRCKFH